MRALAIIFVVMVHALMLEKANTNFPWIPIINGVELFFVLSGFLIGGILIKLFEQKENFGIRTIFNFWIRRWFRTLPNYYFVLLLNIIIVYFGLINEDINQLNWKFIFFLHNFSGHFQGFFLESWSLSVEEWFYLLFPLILAASYFILRRMGVGKKSVFLFSIFVFVVTPFLLRVFIASKIDVDQYWLGEKIFKVVIYRLDSIALGIFAAFIKRWYPLTWFRYRNIALILGIVICYGVKYFPWMPNTFATKVFEPILLSVGCFFLLVKFESIRKGPKLLVKIFTHISLISYSMYLLNLAVIAQLLTTNFPPWGPRSAWGLYIVYWFLTITLSTLLYKYFEKPVMDLRDKWKPQKVSERK
jgi:peptidoglycan/LPS O-acetylase OafA/YrhL